MAGSKAASVGRYYKSAQPCFLASCIRHIIEQGLAFHRIIIIGTRPFLEPVSRARFSRSGHPPRAAPHPDPPARPPRLSLRAPPHRTAPAQRDSLEPSDFPAVRQTAATSSSSYASLLCPVP